MCRFLMVLFALLIAGCADSHKLTRIGPASAPLSPGASAYVALPTDGRYGEIFYASSGGQTAREVAAAFAPYLSKIVIATASEDVATAAGSAAADGYDYLLYPQILHWEDPSHHLKPTEGMSAMRKSRKGFRVTCPLELVNGTRNPV